MEGRNGLKEGRKAEIKTPLPTEWPLPIQLLVGVGGPSFPGGRFTEHAFPEVVRHDLEAVVVGLELLEKLLVVARLLLQPLFEFQPLAVFVLVEDKFAGLVHVIRRPPVGRILHVREPAVQVLRGYVLGQLPDVGVRAEAARHFLQLCDFRLHGFRWWGWW